MYPEYPPEDNHAEACKETPATDREQLDWANKRIMKLEEELKAFSRAANTYKAEADYYAKLLARIIGLDVES